MFLLHLADTSGVKIVVLFVLQHFIEPEIQSLVHFEFMLNEAYVLLIAAIESI